MSKLNISFFSEETLDSLAMAEVMGGTNNCQGGNCGNCVNGCQSNTATGCGATAKVNAGGIGSCTKIGGGSDSGLTLAPDPIKTPFVSVGSSGSTTAVYVEWIKESV